MRALRPTAVIAVFGLCLSACVHSGLAPGKTGEQAAAVNVQLAIEYMKIGKLGPARETIERALNRIRAMPTCS